MNLIENLALTGKSIDYAFNREEFVSKKEDINCLNHKILVGYDSLMDEQKILSIPVIPQIILEGKNIHDIPSFYKEINRVFMQNEDWELGESLDAFNDRLYGGFGILKGLSNIQLIWNSSKYAVRL